MPTPFRYALCNELLADWPFARACEFIAQCGYQGVELAPFTFADDVGKIDPARRREIQRTIQSAGLETLGLHWLLAKTVGLHLTSPDAQTRLRTANYLAALANFCADVGGSLMVLGSPQQRNLPSEVTLAKGHAFARDVLQKVLPTLEATNVTLALEPLGPAEGNFWLTAQETMETVSALNHPRVRLHLDCKAMSSEVDSIPSLLDQHHANMVHFHANDPNRQGPGFGELDFVPILHKLRSLGYSGWISVEVFDYSPGVERLTQDSIRYLKQCEATISS